jgi:membrane fusion protein (multidrug efflux system)
MYVRVVIEQGVQADAIAVPQQAVQRNGNGQALLYILKPDGNLELRPVKAGRAVGRNFVIDDGLKAGEQVVVEGFQKIRPDARFSGTPWKPDSDNPAAAPAAVEKRD